MRKSLFACCVLAGLCPLLSSTFAEDPPSAPSIDVYFSPNGGCTKAIVKEIKRARHSVYIMAYVFTNKDIAKAVTKAKKRGLDVQVILDQQQKQNRYSAGTFLRNNNIDVFIDYEHDKMHNKIMIIDGKVLITGSFNFSRSAEIKNAENVLIIKGHDDLLKTYVEYWEKTKGASSLWE